MTRKNTQIEGLFDRLTDAVEKDLSHRIKHAVLQGMQGLGTRWNSSASLVDRQLKPTALLTAVLGLESDSLVDGGARFDYVLEGERWRDGKEKSADMCVFARGIMWVSIPLPLTGETVRLERPFRASSDCTAQWHENTVKGMRLNPKFHWEL